MNLPLGTELCQWAGRLRSLLLDADVGNRTLGASSAENVY